MKKMEKFKNWITDNPARIILILVAIVAVLWLVRKIIGY
ncbi:hypothetical protein RB2501_14024 [Robiginitalea biformata HTCC2501]|uniref:Uncharacterized protein n=1 Tax=Robiginitalea biformata (strain ATCC BAA-864 / DSM 15991 / KCTC 12146 / HTCC2501) TaxID=313596 RepID=A4CKQ2_ROBBH|nr:hypothetical protein RB2501_14024 [Robiginitalea biformata HTCC2501]